MLKGISFQFYEQLFNLGGLCIVIKVLFLLMSGEFFWSDDLSLFCFFKNTSLDVFPPDQMGKDQDSNKDKQADE